MPSALPLMTECETRKHNYLVMIVIMRTMEEAVFAAETMGVIKSRHENGCSIDGIRGQTPPMTTHIRPLEQNWRRGWWRVGVSSRFSSTFLHSLSLALLSLVYFYSSMGLNFEFITHRMNGQSEPKIHI